MKNLFPVSIILTFFLCSMAQLTAQERGATPAATPQSAIRNPQFQTRAVVVGISDYQDEGIPDLKYAHKDAEAFAGFLHSPAGGALPNEHIVLLTNKLATTGAIAGAMDWLIADSQEGDRVIIFFSGHGDVETRTKFQRGFLLTYDSPATNYLAGAFALIFLQDIISTLADNGVQVILVTDACRAGKLAGSAIGGAQATAAHLTRQFANEIKILSCQPDEFSLEGEQWGGGRGAFSYHLIDGLTGLADGNVDREVNLLEINRYLEEIVPKETAPQVQIPMTVGSKGTLLTVVDTASLAAVKKRKENELLQISTIETKGLEELYLADTDSQIVKKYWQFQTALTNKELLKPAGLCAYDLYLELANAKGIDRLKGIMKRNLATALQDESQQAINAYLRADTKDLEARSRGESRYYKYVEYLEKAAELLGPEHYMYKSLKAKQHYFHAVDLRVRLSSRTFSLGDSVNIWQASSRENIQKALEFESNAAYIFNEMSILSAGEERRQYLEKAIEIAPEWAIPYNNQGIYYRSIKDLEKAESCFRKAIELAPHFSYPYLNMGSNYENQKKYKEAEDWMKKAIERSPGNVQHLNSLATFYRNRNRPEEAEQLWLQVLELNPTYINVYNNLSGLYRRAKQYDQAEAINWKRLEVRPTDGDAYCDLVTICYNSGQMEKVRPLLVQMERIDATIENWEGTTCMAGSYYLLQEYDLALKYALKALQQAPESPWSHKSLAQIYKAKNNPELFIRHLDSALVHGLPSGDLGDFEYRTACRLANFRSFAQRVMDRAPESAYGYYLMGVYYDGQQDFKTAQSYYKKALKLSPDNKAMLFAYAESNYLSGATKKAASVFQQYVGQQGTVYANNKVGGFFSIHGEYDLAEAYLLQALAIDSLFPGTYTELAGVYFISGQPQKAYDLIDQAIALQKDNVEAAAMYHLLKSYFYYYSGAFDDAIISAQKAASGSTRYTFFSTFLEKFVAGDYAAAIKVLDHPDPAIESFNILKSHVCALMEKPDEALQYLEAVLNAELLPYTLILNDPKLESLRSLEAFKALMHRFFPEKQ